MFLNGAVDLSGTRIATASSQPWPIFDHLLPEIAFAGHSNTGKSSLVNVLVGGLPRSGPASVSERAGWTSSVQFYKVPSIALIHYLCMLKKVVLAGQEPSNSEPGRSTGIRSCSLFSCRPQKLGGDG